MMIFVECPWCDGPVAIEYGADEVRCGSCRLVVELAPEPPRRIDAVLAA